MRIYGLVGIIVATAMGCKRMEPMAVDVLLVQREVMAQSSALDTLAYYERTACFGFCPIFSCVFWNNGTVHYVGKNFVERIGSFQTNIDSTALHLIEQTAHDIQYFSLKPVYDGPIHDVPAIITQLKFNDNQLRVINRYKGPKELNQLYQVLDTILANAKWTNANQPTNK
jgi:hypothetical protein